jgi:predicted HicB family RNase H-like nuclease
MLRYKGYVAEVQYDPEAEVYFGIVSNIADTVHFEGDTREDAERAFRDSVDDYVDTCGRTGRTPEKPRSDRVAVRMEADLRHRVSAAAKRANLSMSAFIVQCLAEAVGPKRSTKRGDKGHAVRTASR